MEPTEHLALRLTELESALRDLTSLLAEDISQLNAVLQDGVKNGQVQKFEMCVELSWKTTQALQDVHGIEAAFPKTVVKALFQIGKIDEAHCDVLLEAIDARNMLSQVHRKMMFEQIYQALPNYTKALNALLKVLLA